MCVKSYAALCACWLNSFIGYVVMLGKGWSIYNMIYWSSTQCQPCNNIKCHSMGMFIIANSWTWAKKYIHDSYSSTIFSKHLCTVPSASTAAFWIVSSRGTYWLRLVRNCRKSYWTHHLRRAACVLEIDKPYCRKGIVNVIDKLL